MGVKRELKDKLTSELIDHWAEEIVQYCKDQKLENRNAVRYRLMTEECLLGWMEKLGEGTEVTLTFGTKFSQSYFILNAAGDSFNPFWNQENDEGNYVRGIMRGMGIAPEYSYRKDENTMYFRISGRSKSPFFKLITAVLAALLVAGLGMLLPGSGRTAIMDLILDPLHDTFLNILGAIAGPMIFLSVSWGIYGVGDARTLKKIGSKLMFSFVGMTYLAIVIAAAAAFPFFSLRFAAVGESFESASTLIEMILGVFPPDIVSPFLNGNSLQIIAMGIIVGIALLFLGKQTESVAKAIEQINYIIQMLMGLISKIVPYFIFIVVIRIVWMDAINTIAGVWKLALMFALVMIFELIVFTAFVCIKHKVRPGILLSKVFPGTLIAFTTASSSASFGTVMNACIKKLGIDSSISNFGVPLGMVMFKPNTAVFNLISVYYFAEYYQIDVSVGWIVIAVFMAGILAVATPPIPGGALAAYTILLSQMGIPAEALAILLAIDVFIDFVETGSDIFCVHLELTTRAYSFGMLNLDMLRKR